jgi:hypothetical protein
VSLYVWGCQDSPDVEMEPSYTPKADSLQGLHLTRAGSVLPCMGDTNIHGCIHAYSDGGISFRAKLGLLG